VKDFPKKIKPTLESLLSDMKVVTGKTLLKQAEEKKKEQALFQEAIEFELRNPRVKKSK
jgi:hypothetical protein